MEKIKCTVGILTFNSESTIERCLSGLKDFSEVIISDGGSQDNTIDIAKRYNCKIIKQINYGKPIEDFSLERNNILEQSNNDWFFYLDSDELISDELVAEMKEICNSTQPTALVYRVPYQITSRDLQTKYQSFKTYYQERFFNKKTEARFVRKMHERIIYDKKQYQSVKLNGKWYVPLDVQLDFSVYRSKVKFRLKKLAEDWQPKSFTEFLYKVLWGSFKNTSKQFFKMFYLKLRYGKGKTVPLRYEFFRLYSNLLNFWYFTLRYFRFVFSKDKNRHN
jgi:glycosyltransferase involved in cell wall biosynthesis